MFTLNKQLLKEVKPVFEFVYSLMDELDEQENELEQIRKIANEQKEYAERLLQNEQELRIENHKLQMFIEENVSEDKKKLIFEQSDSK